MKGLETTALDLHPPTHTHSYQLSKLFINAGKIALKKMQHFAACQENKWTGIKGSGRRSSLLKWKRPLPKDQPNQKICYVYKRSCGVS